MRVNRRVLIVAVLVAMLAVASSAQTSNSYQQTNLVSDIPGIAAHTDPALVNPWGLAYLPAQPFWIANNGSGTSTVYDGSGATQLAPVPVPLPGQGAGNAAITGTVANATGDFQIQAVPSLFVFVSENGTISGWGGAGSAVTAVDNSTAGAVYKGLAIGSNATGNFLYAANFHAGTVDVFDRNFNAVHLTGNFTDPNLPAGYAPFGIQNIGNNQIVVTYALQDDAKHDDVAGAGNGYVDLYDTDGRLTRRIASQGTLNSPWGIALAPAGFGAFGGALLIGNFGDGLTNAFDLASGNFLGQLNNTNGQPLSVDGLWAITFGGGGMAGDTSSLYFTAGLNGETHGLFGKLTAAVGTGADFTLGTSQQTLSVSPGNSGTLTINISGTGGFNGPVNLSCPSAPSMVSCAFAPPTVTAGSTAASSVLTVSVASTYHVGPQAALNSIRSLYSLTLLGGICLAVPFRRRSKKVIAGAIAAGLFGLMLLLSQVACGGSSSRGTTTGTSNSVPLTVTATSGAISHSTNVGVMIQ